MQSSRTALETAIFFSGLQKSEIADRAGLNKTLFSGIVNGRIVPSDYEKRRIAKALGKPVDELFTDNEQRATA